jgi:hypothetical protein
MSWWRFADEMTNEMIEIGGGGFVRQTLSEGDFIYLINVINPSFGLRENAMKATSLNPT